MAPTHRARGARAPHFYKWLGTGDTVSRRTANKKLTKLCWPSRKRSPKRLIILLEGKSGGARPPKKFSGSVPPALRWTGSPRFQIPLRTSYLTRHSIYHRHHNRQPDIRLPHGQRNTFTKKFVLLEEGAGRFDFHEWTSSFIVTAFCTELPVSSTAGPRSNDHSSAVFCALNVYYFKYLQKLVRNSIQWSSYSTFFVTRNVTYRIGLTSNMPVIS